MTGGTVCATHGGKAPQVRAAAERRVEEQKAKATIQTLLARELPSIDQVDPLAHLIEVIWITAVTERWLRSEIERPLVTTMFGPQEHPLWALWGKERDKLSKFCEAALRAGVAERQVRMLEGQAQVIADVFRKVFDDPRLGLTNDQRTLVTVVTGEHLRTLAA